jgi:hypothetical protein
VVIFTRLDPEPLTQECGHPGRKPEYDKRDSGNQALGRAAEAGERLSRRAS